MSRSQDMFDSTPPTELERHRFWSKTKPGENGCIEWTAHINRGGYGYTTFRRCGCTASRLAFWLTHGYVTAGWHVHHKCHNRRCVNPKHLIEVTREVNQHDIWQVHVPTTHCPRGHERAVHGRKNKHGWWVCRRCARDRQRAQVLQHHRQGLTAKGTRPIYTTRAASQAARLAAAEQVAQRRSGRVCPDCHTPIPTDAHPRQVYCTSKCRQRHQRETAGIRRRILLTPKERLVRRQSRRRARYARGMRDPAFRDRLREWSKTRRRKLAENPKWRAEAAARQRIWRVQRMKDPAYREKINAKQRAWRARNNKAA